ncbi:hypothetical protein AB4876_10060 [Zhongshania guokunii]|uniref:Uncharacterized protein n=1 Tax=Zhongshania guokunii TaxID=641783 RepID=A0ABV3U5S4_9GAMM
MKGGSNFNLGMTLTASGKAFPRSEIGLLAFSNYICGVTGTQLDTELDLAEKQFQANRDRYNTLWLAIVLMQPHAAPASNQMALRLLNDYVNNKSAVNHRASTFMPSNDSYDVLAKFLLDSATQRQRLIADNTSLKQKIEKLMLIESSLNYPQAQTQVGPK